MKKVYNFYSDKTTDIMKNASFTAEDVFDGKLGKDSISAKQVTKLKNFFSKKCKYQK